MGEAVSYWVAFVAGVLTFLSPCILPLIPSFIAYITGVSFVDLKDTSKRREVMAKAAIHSILFIAGFSVIFILLGLTATFIGKALFGYQNIIRIAGGIFIVLFGLYMVGALRLDFLLKERKFNVTVKGASYFGSFLLGVTFAAAWTPCAGPILGSILVLAGTKADVAEGAKLLTIYSLGVGVPFFLTGISVNYFLKIFNRFKNVIGIIHKIGGVLLIIVGILVATNYMQVISQRLLGMFAK